MNDDNSTAQGLSEGATAQEVVGDTGASAPAVVEVAAFDREMLVRAEYLARFYGLPAIAVRAQWFIEEFTAGRLVLPLDQARKIRRDFEVNAFFVVSSSPPPHPGPRPPRPPAPDEGFPMHSEQVITAREQWKIWHRLNHRYVTRHQPRPAGAASPARQKREFNLR